MSIASTSSSAIGHLLNELSEELGELERAGLRRSLTSIEAINGSMVRIEGRELVCWCSNDYLGLSTHPRLVAAAAEAATQWGVGARASRLLAGTTAWHTRLERALAAWFGADDAIVFASGYLANLGALGALLSPEDTVFVDRLAHASLVDAARATRADFQVFRHNDPDHLASLLKRVASRRRRLIVTEGVFSMDGDVAPLAALIEMAAQHDAVVYLDDAHGAFVLGPTGRGTPEALGVPHASLLYMGTLGKALGCQGGFLAGPSDLVDLLRNRARTFIYATALAVPVAAAAGEALCIVEQEPLRRQTLRKQAARLHERLHAPGAPSHIVPVLLGETSRALRAAEGLIARGHWAPAIRPPTVPKGSARLRLSVSALHTDEQVDGLAAALGELDSP